MDDTVMALARAVPVMRIAHCNATDPDALDRLADGLAGSPLALVMLFASPAADPATLPQRAQLRFPDVPVVGCSTAGEIGADGYAENEIVAVGFPADMFVTETIVIPDLSTLETDNLIGQLIRSRHKLAKERPDWPGEFAFLLVDGMSIRGRRRRLGARVGPRSGAAVWRLCRGRNPV